MASPPIDGFGVSRTGAALAPRTAAVPASLAPTPMHMTNPLLWGFGAALAYLAYLYRRVL